MSPSPIESLPPRNRTLVDQLHQLKERLAIWRLPPTILRLFGDIDYAAQLEQIPLKFRQKVVVLTTSDTPATTVAELTAHRWHVRQSRTVTTAAALENASLLLNEAITYSQETHQQYLLFLSSGFQRHLGLFYSMLAHAQREYRNSDVYYFELPETHEGVSLTSHQLVDMSQPLDFLAAHFPYETALVMNTRTLPPFETQLSVKGALGSLPDSTPLGGMEFWITLLKHYAIAKQHGTQWSPRMVAITLPVPTRVESALALAAVAGDLPALALPSLPASLEVTSSERKLARRRQTFQAVLDACQLTPDDIQMVFAKTQFTSGIEWAFAYEDAQSPVI